MYNGVGYGKLLLFGEHAAVYGYPAVGLALPLSTRITITACAEESAHPDVLTPGLPGADRLILMELWQDLARMHGADSDRTGGELGAHSIELTAWSNLPRGRGLGSSAAACAALVGAYRSFLGNPLPDDAGTWSYAHRLEHRFHGTPSGIDTGLAVYGGCRGFRFFNAELPEIVSLPAPQFPIVAAAVPRLSNTRALVGGIRARYEQGDVMVRGALKQLGALAEQAIGALGTKADAASCAEAAQEADRLLVSLGLDSELTRFGLNIAGTYGALGGKISGAGGGGAFLSIFSPEQAEAAAAFAAALPARIQEQGGEAVAVLVSPPPRHGSPNYEN